MPARIVKRLDDAFKQHRKTLLAILQQRAAPEDTAGSLASDEATQVFIGSTRSGRIGESGSDTVTSTASSLPASTRWPGTCRPCTATSKTRSSSAPRMYGYFTRSGL